MRAVVWIAEGTWEACVDHAAALVPADAEVTLLHVAPSDVEAMAVDGTRRLLGRRPPPPRHHEEPVQAVADEEAEALLEAARQRLGRPAQLVARRGRTEREVVSACSDADLLVAVRDGEARLGPPSLGKRTRFVVDHAPCQVLLVWDGPPPGVDTLRWPPHLRRP
jgi:nucleotide-binding universal stress UspA family protein